MEEATPGEALKALEDAAPDLLDELDRLRGQVARVEALRVWSSDGGLTRRSIRAEHSERGDCVLVEDIEQALAVPAEGGE